MAEIQHTSQFYHSADADEFPIGNYMFVHTGKPIDRYKTYKGYTFNKEDFDKFQQKYFENIVHSYIWQQASNSSGETKIFFQSSAVFSFLIKMSIC